MLIRTLRPTLDWGPVAQSRWPSGSAAFWASSPRQTRPGLNLAPLLPSGGRRALSSLEAWETLPGCGHRGSGSGIGSVARRWTAAARPPAGSPGTCGGQGCSGWEAAGCGGSGWSGRGGRIRPRCRPSFPRWTVAWAPAWKERPGKNSIESNTVKVQELNPGSSNSPDKQTCVSKPH